MIRRRKIAAFMAKRVVFCKVFMYYFNENFVYLC